jgi:hypothetical protein
MEPFSTHPQVIGFFPLFSPFQALRRLGKAFKAANLIGGVFRVQRRDLCYQIGPICNFFF